MRERVWPSVSARFHAPPSRPEFELKIHRNPAGRSRGVVEYRFDGSIRAVAKLYRDPDDAITAFGTLTALWNHGFGETSFYRVPQPFACIEENAVLIMRAAPGSRLGDQGSLDAIEHGVREAARWLATLHSAPHRLGPREGVDHGLPKLAQRLTAATAYRPTLGPALEDAARELHRRLPVDRKDRGLVQTHGRYHPEHVFLTPEDVTVVDLDRAAVSHPAKDIGEFLHRLRWKAGRIRAEGEVAERWTRTFLREYVEQSSTGLRGLSYYWSYSVLSTLLALISKPGVAGRSMRRRLVFLQSELDGIPDRAAPWSD